MTALSIFVVSYTDDSFACSEMFDTEPNARAYVALLESGAARPLYDMGSAWVDCKAVRGAHWVSIHSA